MVKSLVEKIGEEEKIKKYLTKIKTCVIYRAKMESVDTFHCDKNRKEVRKYEKERIYAH